MGVTPDSRTSLRESGLRVTRPRLAVLDAVRTHPHADTATVIDAVRAQLPQVSHQAVYDSLHALTSAGLLRRIQPAGSVARYESRVHDEHHHLVCRSCGRIDDVDDFGEASRLHPADDHGFAVDAAEVIFWGLCRDCAARAASPSQPRPGKGPS